MEHDDTGVAAVPVERRSATSCILLDISSISAGDLMPEKQAPTGDRVFGERVQARRAALSLSQAELAHRLSARLPQDQRVGQTYVSQIERGRIWTSPDKLRAVAAALDTTIAYLMGERSDPMRPRPRPTSLGIGDSGTSDTARRAGEERPEPRAWR